MKDYLFKFGEFVFPMKHIAQNGFKNKPDQRQDLDPYTDSYGVTQRNALEHTKTVITIITNPMSWEEMDLITAGLEANYINEKETDAQCEYYNPRKRTYKTGHFYLDPSVEFVVKEHGVSYDTMTWIFTEY